MLVRWIMRLLGRSAEVDRHRVAADEERIQHLTNAVNAERMRAQMIIEESGRVRREATGLWATDLLANRSHRSRPPAN